MKIEQLDTESGHLEEKNETGEMNKKQRGQQKWKKRAYKVFGHKLLYNIMLEKGMVCMS